MNEYRRGTFFYGPRCIYEENKIRMLSKTELISVYDGTGENKSSDNVEGSGTSVAPLGYNTCE